MRRAALVFVLTIGCGDATVAGGGNGDGGTTRVDAGTSTGPADAGPIETATGCSGVFNPDQVLDYHLELPAADWTTIKADLTFSIEVQAQFRCTDEAPITVGLRRKRSGGTDKVGLKIDVNAIVPGQEHYDLRKLSLENGESSGSANDAVEVRALVAEYLGWRAMVLSGATSGRAALCRVFVNGDLIGVYVNVEQVDKRFLRDRYADDTGWLYKKSGGTGDGLKTHETDGLVDPYDEYFCFWRSGNACPIPASTALETELPPRLDIDQILRIGAVNAILSNTDGIIGKDNNYYWYDRHGAGRAYLPWDLDTTMNRSSDVFPASPYTDALFTHWRDDYVAIVRALVDGPLSVQVLHAEIDRVEQVAAAAFASDPFVVGSVDGAADDLRAFVTTRAEEIEAALTAP